MSVQTKGLRVRLRPCKQGTAGVELCISGMPCQNAALAGCLVPHESFLTSNVHLHHPSSSTVLNVAVSVRALQHPLKHKQDCVGVQRTQRLGWARTCSTSSLCVPLTRTLGRSWLRLSHRALRYVSLLLLDSMWHLT